jgi:serine/threonine-protein kinase
LVAGLAAAYFFLGRDTGRPANAAGVKSLAVLPFKPLVAEGRDEALELGMADTLIAKLSNIADVTVRPLSAVRRYGGLEQDPLAAGRQLGVEAVLDGTVQRSGDSVRVTARLVRVGDGRQLWEGRFDAPFTDIFSVQDSISERVATALVPRLGGEERRRLTKRNTENIEAYQLYLKGRYHVLKLTPADNQKSVSYYQQAIAVDPSYALAYFGLAQAYSSRAISGEQPATEWFPKAKAATLKALELDDQLAEAYASLGYILFWYEWDWNEAENRFRRALELNPNSAETHMGYALLLSNTGRHTEARAEIKRAREHDPLNLLIAGQEGQTLLHAGRADEALDSLRKIIELDPNFWFAHMIASSAYTEKGMYTEAIAEARKAKESYGSSSRASALLSYALAKSGRRAEARAELEGLLRLSKERNLSPFNIALAYNGLGETDEALAWLWRGIEQRDPKMTLLKVDPKWNNLRSDPRFQDLLRRVGFTP